MNEFYSMESTIAGEETEILITGYLRWLNSIDEYEISKGYIKEKDLTMTIDGQETTFEIKLDAYEGYSQRIPIEHKQQSRAGEMLRSGIKVCTADYFCVYCAREKSLYVFNTKNFKSCLSLGRFEENKECNLDTIDNKTQCYMVNISLLRLQYEEYGSSEDLECILDISEYLEIIEKELNF